MPYRTGFQQFLRRPDHKQDFVSQWQADFNSLPDDLWDDEETKAELHQRVNVRESVCNGSFHSQSACQDDDDDVWDSSCLEPISVVCTYIP